MASFAANLLGLIGAGLGVTTVRRDRRRAAALARRTLPGRLRVLSARTLFPLSTDTEVRFAVNGDPDAVVTLRVAGGQAGADALREAVDAARTAADRFRALDAAFRAGGYPVHALGRGAADPWVAADVTNDSLADVLAGLAPCAAAAGTASVLVARPGLVRALPAGDPRLPTLLRLTARSRLAALTGREPYHRVGFDADGVPTVSLVRPFEEQQRYEARVAESAGAWLAGNLPGSDVTAVLGVSRLVAGRADRVLGYVVFRDEPDDSRVPLGNHALRVTTDLSGTLTDPPDVLPEVRDGRGPLRLPPL